MPVQFFEHEAPHHARLYPKPHSGKRAVRVPQRVLPVKQTGPGFGARKVRISQSYFLSFSIFVHVLGAVALVNKRARDDGVEKGNRPCEVVFMKRLERGGFQVRIRG